jgi:hypothetical protein
MDAQRSIVATDPRLFGRRAAATDAIGANSAAEDFRLFAMTFAAGFLFMSVFLA